MQNIDLFDMITDMLSNIGQSSTRTCPKNIGRIVNIQEMPNLIYMQ